MNHRKLSVATPETIANNFKSVVLATLDPVWDPHQSTLVNKLESVLLFAGEMITEACSQHS